MWRRQALLDTRFTRPTTANPARMRLHAAVGDLATHRYIDAIAAACLSRLLVDPSADKALEVRTSGGGDMHP